MQTQDTPRPVIEPAYGRLDEVRALIEEYIEWLHAAQPGLDECLGRQGYAEELENLEGKYGLPDGRLYVAHFGGPAVGCIALRPMPELPGQNACEMKRLYVRPGNRHAHIGSTLVRRIVDDARAMGYRRIYLDTLPILDSAVRMYRGLGFEEIPRYNDNPIPETIYMKMEL